MNIYLLPIYDADLATPQILSFKAKDLKSAKEKVIRYYTNLYNIDDDYDFEALDNYLCDEKNVVIGDLYDIEEFEDRVRY